MNTKVLSTIIKDEIEARFDHKNLPLDCPEFDGKIVSAANSAWVICNILKPLLPPNLKLALVLFETERNFVEIGE